MRKNFTYFIAVNSIIAALYAVCTLLLAPLSYGIVQLRVAECLTILPAIMPFSYVGITIGCLIANCFSPLGLPDIILGTTASLIAGLITSKCRNPFVACIPPVIVNATILPIIWYIFAGDLGYFVNFLSTLISQSIVLFALGVPLYYLMKKSILPQLNRYNTTFYQTKDDKQDNS